MLPFQGVVMLWCVLLPKRVLSYGVSFFLVLSFCGVFLQQVLSFHSVVMLRCVLFHGVVMLCPFAEWCHAELCICSAAQAALAWLSLCRRMSGVILCVLCHGVVMPWCSFAKASGVLLPSGVMPCCASAQLLRLH